MQRCKRWLAVLSASALLFAMNGCGAQPNDNGGVREPASQTQAAQAPQAEGDIAEPNAQKPADENADPAEQSAVTEAAQSQNAVGPLFQKYVRDAVSDGAYTMTFKQSGMSVYTVVNGADSAMESNTAGLIHFTLINKDGKYYMLMHTTKKYVEMTEQEYNEEIGSVEDASMNFDELVFQKDGTATVAGKKYSTETYDEGERGTVIYYFDDTGLRRATVKKDGKTTLVDTFEVRDEPDMTAFDIPTDYTLVPDAGQLFT